ncbi:hypothetical protein [Bradyrhizobium japonicum]|uniref:hypothetical protein n=1 Tax=Bradyrhizobium japonicum TaxID=375 RepID=UPI0004BBBF2A|nr:hypothetical protein [Bradyrhizobium japonicum]
MALSNILKPATAPHGEPVSDFEQLGGRLKTQHNSTLTDFQASAVQPSALNAFHEHCEARALLIANGLMSLQEAVDGLQETAALQGLVAEHGQDTIQAIMAEAFARWPSC